MSDETNEKIDSQGAPPASTPPQDGTEASNKAAIFDGPDVPSYLQGKTQAEALAWVDTLVQGVRQMSAAPVQPKPSVQVSETLRDVNPDQLLTDPTAWQQAFEQRIATYVNAQVAGAAQAVLPQVNDAIATQAKNDPKNRAVAEKYWPEVEKLVAAVPAHLRTAALYDKTVTLVKGEHFDEFVTEAQAKAAAAATGVEGASNSGSAPAADTTQAEVWSKIESSDLGKQIMNVGGKSGVINAAKAMGLSVDKYAEMITAAKTTFDPRKPGEWSTQLTGASR